MEIIVRNANDDCVRAIETLLKDFEVDYEIYEDNERSGISDEDEAHLQETIEMDKRGELQYHTFEESSAIMDEYLKGLGCKDIA